MSDIFISYKREEVALAKALAGKLSELGWSIWWDQDIPAGKSYFRIIEEELKKSRCVIVLWTNASVDSENVIDEARDAVAYKTYLPVAIGDIRLPYGFRSYQAVLWNRLDRIEEDKFSELVENIKNFLGEPPVTPSKSADKIAKNKEIHIDAKVSEKKSIEKKHEIEFDSVQIGNQIWMKRNLDVDRFRNGDTIPQVKDESEWAKARKNRQPAWCCYDNDIENGKVYGKLYNWYAVNDPRGLAPEGWHIPSDDEWTILTDYLGGKDTAGGKMKSTETQYWKSPNTEATNESGFSGLPGGCRYGNGVFDSIGKNGLWWSSSEINTLTAWYRYLGYDGGKVFRLYFDTAYSFSVRCLRD